MAFRLTVKVQPTPVEQAMEEAKAQALAFIERLDRRSRSPIREDRKIQDDLVRVVHRLGRVMAQAGWYPCTDLMAIADKLVSALPSHSYESQSGEIVRGSYGDPDKAEALRAILYEGFGLPVPTDKGWYESATEWQETEDSIFSREGEI